MTTRKHLCDKIKTNLNSLKEKKKKKGNLENKTQILKITFKILHNSITLYY